MSKREMVQLAKTYVPGKHAVLGWFISEKLDGMRAWWDGGISRGKFTVPYANTAKDSRYVERLPATGLWSRYAKPIHAPDWWLNTLPEGIPLDGELFMGRGKFQQLRSIVSRRSGGNWSEVQYVVFDSPDYIDLFMSGRIQSGARDKSGRYGHTTEINYIECLRFFGEQFPKKQHFNYLSALKHLKEVVPGMLIEQKRIEHHSDIDEMLDQVLINGGEGIMLRNPAKSWYPTRNINLLKYKPYFDDLAVVIGHVAGTGKHEGKLGSIQVEWRDVTFYIGTGFTDEERANPPEIGDTITFRFRELTDDGIPKEARFLEVLA